MEKIEVKNKYFFKNKIQMIVYIILFIFLIYMFIYLGNLDYEKDIPDNERFASEFNLVSQDNVFKYINNQDAQMLISGKDAIIFIGINNEWVNYYAKILNDAAKSVNIMTINYYNIADDRELNNWYYEAIVDYLKDYVVFNDNGNSNLYAPTLIIKKNNQIVYFDTETSFVQGAITPSNYWKKSQIERKKTEIETALRSYIES